MRLDEAGVGSGELAVVDNEVAEETLGELEQLGLIEEVANLEGASGPCG